MFDLLVRLTSWGQSGARLVIVFLTVTPVVAAVDPEAVTYDRPVGTQPEFIPAPTEAFRMSDAALKAPVSITFNNESLHAALERLSVLAGVPIKLSSQIAGEPPTDKVTGIFDKVPLKIVLSRAIHSPNSDYPQILSYAAEDGILVTIRSAKVSNAVTRIYPCGDLCASGSDAEQLVKLLSSSTGMYWKASGPDGIAALSIRGALWTADMDDDVFSVLPYASSISYLDSVQGLVVNTDGATHFEILNMLRMIREAKKVQNVPPRHVGKL